MKSKNLQHNKCTEIRQLATNIFKPKLHTQQLCGTFSTLTKLSAGKL